MKRMLAVAFCTTILCGCSGAPEEEIFLATTGLYVSAQLTTQLQEDFAVIAQEEQSIKRFEELNIVFVPIISVNPPILASFVPPNKIELAIPVYRNKDAPGLYKDAIRSFLRASPDDASPFLAGITVSLDLATELKQRYEMTKQCMGLEQGSFHSLTIQLMPLTFSVGDEKFFGGAFCTPSTVFLGRMASARHEFVHALLWENTGDFDGAHQSEFFQKCVL